MKKARLADTRVARVADKMAQAPPADVDDPPATGSRGGVTTVTIGGLLRKTSYFEPVEWRAIRARADHDMTTAAEVIRRAVREYLDL